ncbi:MAG TPA: hypothetical protein VI454_13150 [Verrucomicrobiae bacterium]|jgi:hypothetical protein
MKFSSNSARILASLFPFAAAASVALAHPGHPINGSGVAHIASSPYHLATLAGSGLLFLGAAWFIRQQTPRRVLQYAGVVAIASAVLLWGIRA